MGKNTSTTGKTDFDAQWKKELEDIDKKINDAKIKNSNEDIKKIKKRTFNIETKKFFHNLLIEAIEKGDEEKFDWCLRKIRTEWHVARTVPVEQLNDFIKYMWKNRNEIKRGTYHYWESDKYKSLEINKGNNKYFVSISRPCSYESKICFVISPDKYYLIYDENNKKALKALKDKRYKNKDVSIEHFNETAEDYITNIAKPKETDKKTIEEAYFEVDYELWAANN